MAAGFIGSALVRHFVADLGIVVLNIDKLTYSGNIESIASVSGHSNHHFLCTDICDEETIGRAIKEFQPDAVMHLAAESHVDRSIDSSSDFVQTNLVGTFSLLEAVRTYWAGLPQQKKRQFLFHHISTDEVYGDLEPVGISLLRRQVMLPALLMQQRWLVLIILFAPGTGLTGYQRLLPTVQTTMVHINSRKN